MKKVYLDANASTRVREECVKSMLPFFGENYGNASSVHSFGREARKHIDKARKEVAELISASLDDEIIFTSGGTESDNLAIKGAARALKDKGRHIITSSVEHKAVLSTCKALEKEGFRVTYLEVDQYGIVDPKAVEKSISGDTILISIMAANNETGTVMPMEEIGKIAEAKKIAFHTDAVQALGKSDFDVKKTLVSYASFSAHKMHGPKGAGALYVKKGMSLESCQHGGSQEKKKRAGTENVPGIIGFGEVCKTFKKIGEEETKKVKILGDMLYGRINSEIKDIYLNGHAEKRLGNTLNVSFIGVSAESLVQNLDMEGIAVGTGSACASGSPEPSHVLESIKIGAPRAKSAIRFSLSGDNSEEDINYLMSKLPGIIDRLRKIGKK